ncbi:MAG: hypothetical protein Q8S13_13915, partial [Dehalococcoidia bacterium]|nr:hypothetical protein [Dehalococcoidia bacterium]
APPSTPHVTLRPMSRKPNPNPRKRLTVNLIPEVYADVEAEAEARRLDKATVAGERIGKATWRKPKENP